ncbi:MAG: electron transport complex subunit E [Oscillospiraceae bacterium]|nr:electron transport complex subunit E [Oscillospiraceae bacterium]
MSNCNDNNNSFKKIIKNGLINKNPILVSGMVIAPVIVLANNFNDAVMLVAAFSLITFFTLLISSFVPKSIVYTIRIILYTLIGAVVYVPSVMLLEYLMPEGVEAIGIFFPLFITNSFIVTRSESIFFLETKGKMLLDIIFCIIGYDAAVLIFSAVREILASGTIGGKITGMPSSFRVFEHPFGGFILLGLFAALFRSILLLIKRVQK